MDCVERLPDNVTRMEMINVNTSNIVFGSGRDGRESNDEIGTFKISKPFRQMRSPKGSTFPKPSKSPRAGLTSLTPIKGQPLESPFRNPLTVNSTPVFESPTKDESPVFKGKDPSPSEATPILETPLSWRDKRVSPGDVEIGEVYSSLSVSPSKINPKIRAMYNGARGKDAEEMGDVAINPDPVPYQPSNFIPHRMDRLDSPDNAGLSSTVLKKFPVPRRHLENFGDFGMGSKRGVILHTDRYQWDVRAIDGLNQRDRLEAELQYIERLRGIKRRREVLPHRAQLDLLMGGKKIEFTERFDIQREIQKLRSLILPQNAKDLYHGRGFTLPEAHNSVKPRRPLPLDIDFDDDQDYMDPGRGRPRWQKQGDYGSTTFPKINSRGYLLGHGAPLILSKEKRTVDSIKARLQIPTSATQPAYLQRSKTNVVRTKPANVRSLTAVPVNKGLKERPAATAPTGTTQAQAAPKDIKIPVSGREDSAYQDSRMVLVEALEEESHEAEIEEWPQIEEDVEIATVQEEAESRKQASRLSHHTRLTASPTKAPTPNPLKGSELPSALSHEEQTKLKQTFAKLDTDQDGHLMFNQLQTQLPKQFSVSQEKFIRQVYDITSSSTFFGVDEFMTMSYLTQTVTNITGPALDAYSKLDFNHLHEMIVKYVELFQTVDRNHRGKISLDSLREILQQALGQDLQADPQHWDVITDVISPSEVGAIGKIEFLAHIPYFETLGKK